MVIAFKSLPLSDSHASAWKFGQMSYPSQVRKELPCPKHKVKGQSLSTWQAKYGQISQEIDTSMEGGKIPSPNSSVGIYRKFMKSQQVL